MPLPALQSDFTGCSEQHKLRSLSLVTVLGQGICSRCVALLPSPGHSFCVSCSGCGHCSVASCLVSGLSSLERGPWSIGPNQANWRAEATCFETVSGERRIFSLIRRYSPCLYDFCSYSKKVPVSHRGLSFPCRRQWENCTS